MDSPIQPVQAVQAPYGRGGGGNYRTPPPDLPSLLLKERIVYFGLPLISTDENKARLGIDVTELLVAQLLYLQFDDPEKPITMYINSPGSLGYGYETEAFAICDTMSHIKPPIHTICIGQAMGTAAMILSSGAKGYRASLPNGSIILHQNYDGTQGQATDIQIRAKEVLTNKRTTLEIFSQNTGQSIEKLEKDTDRMFFMTPQEAKEYGLIDKVLESARELPTPVPALT